MGNGTNCTAESSVYQTLDRPNWKMNSATIRHSTSNNVGRPYARRNHRMREIWLRTNRRAILFGCVPPLLLIAAGIWMAYEGVSTGGTFWLAGLVLALGFATIG